MDSLIYPPISYNSALILSYLFALRPEGTKAYWKTADASTKPVQTVQAVNGRIKDKVDSIRC